MKEKEANLKGLHTRFGGRYDSEGQLQVVLGLVEVICILIVVGVHESTHVKIHRNVPEKVHFTAH